MASFMGMFDYSIDNKGRVNIPVKLRKCLNPESKDTFVLTRGFEKCILVYPLNEWNELEKKFRSLNTFDKEQRFFQRSWLMWANQQELDAQSRIMIPKELLEYANIKNEVKVVGLLDRIEIWDPFTYENYLKSQPENYEEVAQKVMGKHEERQ